MTPLRRLRPLAFALGLAATLLAGCVGSGGYYDDGFGTGDYGVYGADYGGWGPGFGIGPYRDGRQFEGARFGHIWRERREGAIPSIAGHERFGGFRGGGFRGGHGFGGGHGR